ncbi:MAG: class I SAM-dependent methyltransferase [Ignavibacteriales bacterium]|nr:class I SAM-dependent methyltransferase [Ignavibacteriales bacterium]
MNRYFENALSFWEDIYERDTLEGSIYQRRKRVALSLIDELNLPRESNVLEIGCGAGLLTMDLAKKYSRVKAIDGVEPMVNVTRQKVAREGLQHIVCVERGDAHSLQSSGNTFNLVVALGLIPWLHSPELAIKEMARVLKPGGYIVVSSDNRYRLNHLIDPRLSPGLSFLRAWIKELLIKLTLCTRKQTPLPVRMYSLRTCDSFFFGSGLRKMKGVTVGFGPYSFFGKTLCSERLGIQIHEFLQRLSDRRIPPFRSLGSHYLVVARKP